MGVDAEAADEAISSLLKEGTVKYTRYDDVQYIYSTYSYESEKYIASKLTFADKLCPAINIEDVERFIDKEEISSGIKYASLQKKAIAFT